MAKPKKNPEAHLPIYAVLHTPPKSKPNQYPGFCVDQSTDPGNRYVMDLAAAELTRDVLRNLHPNDDYEIVKLEVVQ